MQPQFVKVPDTDHTSFLFRNMVVPYFYNPYHFHPEYELTYIINGHGTRYIGDHIDRFSEGDLILIGANLPHMWKCDNKFYYSDADLESRAIVIQFKEVFTGKEFWELPEMNVIRSLFAAANHGIKITGETQKTVTKMLLKMQTQQSIERIADLISILATIGRSSEYELLSSPEFAASYKDETTERLNKVYSYIINNFTDEIQLDQVAYLANMSPTAFCRYFKNRTNKTFSYFLLETRINYACRLLLNDNLSISQIAFESGFNTCAYFNRQFKKMKGVSPMLFRKKFILN